MISRDDIRYVIAESIITIIFASLVITLTTKDDPPDSLKNACYWFAVIGLTFTLISLLVWIIQHYVGKRRKNLTQKNSNNNNFDTSMSIPKNDDNNIDNILNDYDKKYS